MRTGFAQPAMQCCCVTVVVALAGAGVLVAAPSAAPPAVTAGNIVELAASRTDPYADLITNTVANLVTIGAHWRDDPLPAWSQLITNWAGYVQTTVGSLTATGQSFADGLANLPDQLQTLFGAVTTGNVEEVAAMLIIIALSINPIPALVDRLLGIPYDIAGNVVNAAMTALHAAQVPIGLAALDAVQATFGEIIATARDFVDELRSGDLAGALTDVIGAPATILNATLNSDTPGLPGLLTSLPDPDQTGFVDAALNVTPRAIADAIGALASTTTGE